MADPDRVQRRMRRTLAHLSSVCLSSPSSAVQSQETVQTIRPRPAHPPLKWNGWGYEGTEFRLNQEGQVYLAGDTYELCNVPFPKFRSWLESTMDGMDVEDTSEAQASCEVHPAICNDAFLEEVRGHYTEISMEDSERLMHAHGHTNEDIWKLRYEKFARCPDAVIWPGEHAHVEVIMSAAVKHDVAIIPFGGGTSVTDALACPENEQRMVIALDMRRMDRIKWVDRDCMMIRVESGIVGIELERRLAAMGLVIGHEPDSYEFSTVGGWIATRASGMKKNTYGNIEDMLVHVTMVTPQGTLEKNCQVPRVSIGPDLHDVVLGSEGTLGVITEATFKVRPAFETRQYGSVVFPNFETGVAFMRDVALHRCAPASIRLVDNMQFQFGQALAPQDDSNFGFLTSYLKKMYITKWAGFDIYKMVAATLLFEGSEADVAVQQEKIYALALKHGGVKGGEENGKKGYNLTYFIAYLRDFGMNYHFLSESFETSVPWSNVLSLCSNVKARIRQACSEHNLPYEPWISCRVTQTYDTGACVYFYMGFIYRGMKEHPIHTFNKIEAEARDEILRNGGSLSHHHGIGKLRAKWMRQSVSDTGMKILKAIKESVDPSNVLVAGNFLQG